MTAKSNDREANEMTTIQKKWIVSTTRLRRYAQTATRRKHALHHLAISQIDQQPCDAIIGGIFTP
jgi:hypothetical protein